MGLLFLMQIEHHPLNLTGKFFPEKLRRTNIIVSAVEASGKTRDQKRRIPKGCEGLPRILSLFLR